MTGYDSHSWPYDVRAAFTATPDTRAEMIGAAHWRLMQASNEYANLHLIAAAHALRAVAPNAAAIVVAVSDFDRAEPTVGVLHVVDADGNQIPFRINYQNPQTNTINLYLTEAFTHSTQFGEPGGFEVREDLDDVFMSYTVRHYQITIDRLPGFDGRTITWRSDTGNHTSEPSWTGASNVYTDNRGEPQQYDIGRGDDGTYVPLLWLSGVDQHLGVYATLQEAQDACELHEQAAPLTPERQQ